LENIERQQILSQIETLNKDFSNGNIDQIPSKKEFDKERQLATDSKIRFRIADKDPNGNSVEGITRSCTLIESFTKFSDSSSIPIERQLIKVTKLGGKDGWPSDKYLNVWICKLEGEPGAYTQFPLSGLSESQYLTDGIVIDYRCFGLGGTAIKPFDLGRTLTHEIGHWLGLLHIWGNGDGRLGCKGDDGVIDTPKQNGPQTGCPDGHDITKMCGLEFPLLFNFMDYLDDKCSLMFTEGQVSRMQRHLKALRSTFIK